MLRRAYTSCRTWYRKKGPAHRFVNGPVTPNLIAGTLVRLLPTLSAIRQVQNRSMGVIKLFTALVLVSSVTSGQVPPKLTVLGLSNTSAAFSVNDLAQLPQHKVKATNHGRHVSFQSVLLRDLFAKVRTPTGEPFNGTVASYYVIDVGGFRRCCCQNRRFHWSFLFLRSPLGRARSDWLFFSRP